MSTPMSINVQCAGCEKKLKAKDKLAGKRVKCPGCGHIVVVPHQVRKRQVWRYSDGHYYSVESGSDSIGYRLMPVDEGPNHGSGMNISSASDLLHGSGWTFVREPSSDANLFEACEVGDVGRVRELLGADATLAKVKEVGHIMPLHGAAAQGHKEIVELLVQAGADVNAANQWGVTPIYFAAAWGHKEVAMFLIDRGADVHVKAHDGETPLQVAKRKGHEEVVQLLTRTERLRTSGENKHVAAYFLVMVAVFCLGLGLVCLTIPGGSEKLTEQQAYAIGWMMTAIGVVASLATTYLLITGARERGFFLTDRVLKKTRAAVGKHRREAEVKKTWPSVCADCGLPDPEGMYAQLPGGRRRCRKCLGILGP